MLRHRLKLDAASPEIIDAMSFREMIRDIIRREHEVIRLPKTGSEHV